nr:hypothetical protein Ade03nite_46530 [Actinoplanes derwentensis]
MLAAASTVVTVPVAENFTFTFLDGLRVGFAVGFSAADMWPVADGELVWAYATMPVVTAGTATAVAMARATAVRRIRMEKLLSSGASMLAGRGFEPVASPVAARLLLSGPDTSRYRTLVMAPARQHRNEPPSEICPAGFRTGPFGVRRNGRRVR